MQKTLFKKGIILVEIIFLVGINAVSSIENTSEEINIYPKILETTDISEKSWVCNHQAYIGGDSIYEFTLNDPENLTDICDNLCECGSNMVFMNSATWTYDQRLFTIEYFNGALYEIDIETCELSEIGGGGTGLNSLTYDIVNEIMYGCSSYDLMKINPEDGSQEVIGSFGTGTTMIAIACDKYGVMYGWDAKFSGQSYLYKIDKETGQAIIVNGMGINLLYSQDGDFCKVDNILYLAGYVTSPFEGYFLFECNQYTGECTIVGQFEGNVSVDFFVIPHKNVPPIPKFNWTPTIPEPGETIIFNASESIDPDGYIKLYAWDWDNDGVFDYKNYSSPIATHIFEEVGFYPVTLRVKDNNFTNNSITQTIRVGNEPPSAQTITGETNGKAGVEYTYCIINVTDPDGDDIWANFSWGDGSYSGWIGPNTSGEDICASHVWERGIYAVKAKLKDEWGLESGWSDSFPITMPKNKLFVFNFPLLNRLFERFPKILPILKYIVGLS